MKMTVLFKGALVSSAMIVASLGSANAQACQETQFSSKNAELYLKAETEFITNGNNAGALAALQQLRQLELNCYEDSAAQRLAAAIKIDSGDFAGAARDFERMLASGIIPAADRTKTLYDISQIYLNADNQPKALEYLTKWIQAGGRPNRDTKWQLAVLNNKQNRNREAARWAEEVFRDDGPNAARQVYDFLIYLYDDLGELGKKAQLLEQLLIKNPSERKLWDAISGDYYKANDERKAFEVQKAMYLGGILQTEDELMRVVNFYNRFNAPYQAAKTLEKEMNAGRISKNYDRLELLANLYQVAREYERAIPIIEEAARISPNGQMYERLGRSYSELRDWSKAEQALQQAINKGGLKDKGLAWVLIGQSRFERDDRAGARDAFRTASNRAGRGWLDFLRSEDATAAALIRFERESLVQDLKSEQKRCKDLAVLGDQGLPESCKTVEDRLDEAEAAVAALDA